MAEAVIEKWRCAGAVALTLACLVAGNVLGLIITSIWGWENLQYGKPGGVALSFVQGLAGALIALIASEHFLKTIVPTKACLKWLVRVLAVIMVVLIASGLAIGSEYDPLSWKTLAGFIWLVGLEVGRRSADEIL